MVYRISFSVEVHKMCYAIAVVMKFLFSNPCSLQVSTVIANLLVVRINMNSVTND